MSYYSKNDNIDYEPLSRDREAHLFATLHGGGKGATAARDEIIHCHLKLVAKLAIQYAKRALDDDLAISAGNMGLMQALKGKKFDVSRGLRFATYVRSFVRGQVYSAMKANHLAFCMSPGEGVLRIVSDDSTITGAASSRERNYPIHGDLTKSIHSPYLNAYMEALAPEACVDHAYEEKELTERRREAVLEAIKRLNPLEALVIERNCLDGVPLSDIAREQKVSRQACSQAQIRGMRKLYALLSPLRKELL